MAAVGSRYARLCGELLDTGARIAVRSYSHCPQTARVYYKPPSTAVDATGDDGARRSSAVASPSRREKQQLQQEQAEAAARAVLEASEIISYDSSA